MKKTTKEEKNEIVSKNKLDRSEYVILSQGKEYLVRADSHELENKNDHFSMTLYLNEKLIAYFVKCEHFIICPIEIVDANHLPKDWGKLNGVVF